MASPATKWLTAFSALAAVLVVGALVLALRSPAKTNPLPNPNAYDEFMKAAKALPSLDYSTLDGADLRSVLSTNADTLKLVRAAFNHQSRVPLEFVPEPPHFPALGSLKRLAQALVAQGRLAEQEKRPADAAECYLATMRLGTETRRGGLIIDALVGIAIEALGVARLERLAPALDARTCREAVAVMERLESSQESARATIDQEHAWVRRAHGFKGQLFELLPASRKTEKAFMTRVSAQNKRTEQLMITLAEQAFQLDQGRPATNVSELVPKYLTTIPANSLTSTNTQSLQPKP